MTLSEIQSLREEKPMEFNRLVAEKVHGWRLHKNPKQMKWIPPSGNFLNPWHKTEEGAWDYAVNYMDPRMPQFHSDANADLLSHRVACGWIFSKRTDYLETLKKLWLSRIADPSCWGDLLILAQYEVGDWSMCALTTVMEDSAKGEE